MQAGAPILTGGGCVSGAGAGDDLGGAVRFHGHRGHQAERRARRHPHHGCGHRGGVYATRGCGKLAR